MLLTYTKIFLLTLIGLAMHLPAYQQVFIAPEIYHVERTRHSGSNQPGWMGGGRIGYERIKRYGFYLGADGFYARGKLHGKTADKKHLRSHFTDSSIEGRWGYTFKQKCGYQFSLTPFIGGGYAIEKNNFLHPSPLRIHSKIKLSYTCAGFLSSMQWNPEWMFGINFKVKFMFDGRNHVSHDSDYDDAKMLIKNEQQYRLELPVTYQYCECYSLGVVPFYEFRHYGKQANYPFDFVETRLKIFGLMLRMNYSF